MAGLPFNPMSFVTPYTAVSTANAGKAFGDSMAQAKATKVSEGYLANTQHQTAENDKRYGQKQMDDARERLDGALMSGNQDAVELAANNLRAIAGRYGFSLSETRSDAQLKSGVSTPVGKQEAEVGTEEKPFDVDAYDAGKAQKPDPSAFTGLQQGEEADLSQGDFEKQLIDGYKPRDSYERGGKTTPETLAAIRPPGGSLPQSSKETTQLTASQEKAFQAWAKRNGVTDVNDPEAHYDYRGFWLDGGDHKRGDHFPDTFKQHGHETFSEESRYSGGVGDGGRWDGENFIPAQRSPFTGNMAPGSRVRPPGGSLPQVDDLGDVDSPEFKAADAAEKGTPIRVPGGSLPMAPASPVAEPPGTSEAPLRGYTINGPDGKPIYSVAPKDIMGRQQKRVGDVFTALAGKTDDPQELRWLEQAKAETEKLVGIMPLDEAVKTGLSHYVGQMNSRDKLTMVEANHRPRGGGGGGGGLMGKGSDIAESLRLYSGPARTAAMKTVTEDQQYADMEAGLNSGDPALQRNAINVLYKIRAGTAVSSAEDARVGGIVSALDKLENKFRQWTGGPISPELLDAMKQIVATKRKINQDFVQRIFDQAADEYEAQNEGKTKDPGVLKKRSGTIRKGSKIIGTEGVSEDDF